MSDFQRQLSKHYESQKLSDESARAILGRGQAVAAARAKRRRWLLSAAAVLVVALGLYGIMGIRGSGEAGGRQRIVPADAAAAVVNHFSRPDYEVSQVSADPADLTRWLRAQGAPGSFTIPNVLAGLPSYGCHVLDVHGQRVFLICFFLDVSPQELAAGAMIKKDMVVTAPDGTMMKKNRPLVHLVFAPRSAFREAPKPGTRVRLASLGEWNFQTWSQDDTVYLLAAAATPERIAALTGAL